MMRKLVLVMLLSSVSSGVLALGLGNIELNSGLNQPFDARIELLSPTASELDSLTVSLASLDAFSRAGIEREFILSSLRFEVQQSESGRDYIHVTSREALREPFLNFLIEASWSSGRLYREYTVLLDPPLYDPNAGRLATVDAGSQQSMSPASSVASESSGQQFSGPRQVESTFSGNEVGPVAASDTLWSIASRVRPDSSVSVNQMMIALLRANPEAFIGNNINGLRQGQILRVPALDDVTSTSNAAAIAEVSSQNAMWDEIRGSIAANTSSRPISTSADAPQSTGSASVSGNSSELRLVAAGNQTTDTGQSTGMTSSTISDANYELINEQLESMTSENSDLRNQLTESETIIQDLRRLIELKDDELAAMQQQIGDEPVVVSEDIEVAGDTVVDPQDEIEPLQSETGADMETATDVDTTAEQQAETDAEPVADTAEETVETEVATEPEPVVTAVSDTSSDQSIVELILNFVFGNIMLVGAGLVALILAGLIPAFIRKRKEAADDAGLDSSSEFPDFDNLPAGSDETEGPQIDIDLDNDLQVESASVPVEVVAEADEPSVAPEPELAAPEAAEEDPLAEVNVFLAYEHFDSAEEFVRDAISRQPDNLDFHSKLLEVFYSAGDKVKYETEARVLHDLVDGSGPHWDMATIMWQEMSPNRPLFAEPADGEEDAREDITGSRGIVDLTADDDVSDDDAGLDFDLGMSMEDSKPASSSGGSGDMLDITAGSSDVLDVTASESSQQNNEDILDVTAAVGLDTATATAGDDDFSLDLPGQDDQDILDISASGTDDLLDVTAHSDLENDDNEDVLDISSAGSDLEQSLEFTGGQGGDKADDNSLDFDIGGSSFEPTAEVEELADSAGTDEDMISLDDTNSGSSTDDDAIEIDFGTEENPDEGSLELSMDSDNTDSDGGIELDFDSDNESASDDSGIELSLDDNDQDSDGGIELSLDADAQDGDGGIELDFSGIEDSVESGDDHGLDLSFDNDEVASPSIDMESTVKIPKRGELSLDNFSSEEDDDDDDDDHTVFVPRTKDTGEQSAEDENATKLDLAKAYVELGDGSNAKSILEEVIADGNPSQRRQAQELMAQIA